MRWMWAVLPIGLAAWVSTVGCSEDEGGGEGGATTSTTSSTSSTTTSTTGTTTGQGGGGAAPACSPHPVDGFTPTWTPPEAIYQGLCTDAEVESLLTSCFEGTQTACDAAMAAAPACWACMISDFTDSTWGPIFDAGDELGFLDRNWAGCVAQVEGDLTADGCGAKVAAFWQCQWESCAGCYPVSSANFADDLAAANLCGEEAARVGGPCRSYRDAMNECVMSMDTSHCTWRPALETWVEMATRYGKLFCASDPSGAGGGGGAGGASGGAGGASGGAGGASGGAGGASGGAGGASGGAGGASGGAGGSGG